LVLKIVIQLYRDGVVLVKKGDGWKQIQIASVPLQAEILGLSRIQLFGRHLGDLFEISRTDTVKT
jgi:hypothetical protein